jgi:hypothetical protein
MGFLASAVLPADAYLVRPHPCIIPLKLTRLATLRLPHRRLKRRLLLHPPSARLAVIKPPLHRRSRARNRDKRDIRCSRTNRWCLDLQGERGASRVSDGPLDECRAAPVCVFRVCCFAYLLCVSESEAEGCGGEGLCLLTGCGWISLYNLQYLSAP